jgi:uncharacterized protein YheU (UPF0270 family)
MDADQPDEKTGILVPKEKLSNEALAALIDEFILREGTDYGTREYDLDDKRKQVYAQLNGQHIFILFDPQQENTTLLTRDQLQRLRGQNYQIVSLSADS